MIVKRKNGYKLKTKTGRILPKVYSTKAAAKTRIKQIKAHA